MRAAFGFEVAIQRVELKIRQLRTAAAKSLEALHCRGGRKFTMVKSEKVSDRVYFVGFGGRGIQNLSLAFYLLSSPRSLRDFHFSVLYTL